MINATEIFYANDDFINNVFDSDHLDYYIIAEDGMKDYFEARRESDTFFYRKDDDMWLDEGLAMQYAMSEDPKLGVWLYHTLKEALATIREN